MDFEKNIPEWNAEGSEPPASLKESGFQAGYRPPAAYFNWFWHSVGECLSEIRTKLSGHADSTSNPHGVTKAQVGLGNVDNTADSAKPVSTAQAAAIADAKKAGTDAQTNLNTHTANTDNPHSVTKAQVGLGNVPNVATNDQTPTYTQASTLANLTSGEKLSVSFGKIMKAITDLISHIGNKSNPHGVTAAQVGAAASSHKHAAGDITSGTLAVARGGTGVTANPSMLTNLGSTSAASVFAASPRPGVTGTLPIGNGGTGATTAEAARTALGITPANIGAAASDHDHDATELGFMRADNVYGAPVFGDNDLNNWTQPGVYNCPSGATNVPSGLTDNYGVVTVFNVHGLENNLVQIFSPWTSSTSKIYMRTKNRTVWNGWKEIATTDLITAGTTDMTAGTSTGTPNTFYFVYET